MKMLFHYTYLPFLLSNPKILKAFQNIFSTKMKPTINAQQKEKNDSRKAKEVGEERKWKEKVNDPVSL